MFGRIYINKTGCLTKESAILTIKTFIKDFNINIHDLPEINAENYNFIQLMYELELNNTLPVIPINLEIEKRLDFEYSKTYINTEENTNNKWYIESTNSKFNIFINNYINTTNYLTKLIENIKTIEEYNKYKNEIIVHKKIYKKINQQFIIKNEIKSIYNGIMLIFKNIEINKKYDNYIDIIKDYITDVNLLINRNNDCMFYFHKLKNKNSVFKGLNNILDPNNLELINNNIIKDQENLQKKQEISESKDTEIKNCELEIENIMQQINSSNNNNDILEMQNNILKIREKIINIETEKYHILNTEIKDPTLQNNILYKINLYMEDPKYFNEEYYIKLGYYFPKMQLYIKHTEKKLFLNSEINKINQKKYNHDSIAIMNTNATIQKQSELENYINTQLNNLNSEMQKLLENIPIQKYPVANEILLYSIKNNIDITKIVSIK